MKIIDAVKIAGDKSALDIKTNVKSVIDMAKHSLDDELLILDQKPFQSLTITNRMMKVEDISVSMFSSLYWYDKAKQTDNDGI